MRGPSNPPLTAMSSASQFEEFLGSWDYGELSDNIRLGNDCFLERKASFDRYRSTLNPGLVIGDGVKVYTWTVFNVEPSGYVEVGDDSVLVGAVFMCQQSIRIGKRVVISYNVTIADSDFHPIDPDLRRADAIANAPSGDQSGRPAIIAAPISVEDDAWIGIGAIILKGVTIGRGARVEAGAVVTKDVPPQTIAAGNPALPSGRIAG